MNYVNFHENIVLRYKIYIRGWPTNIPFIAPSLINSLPDLQTLADAWTNGTARWASLNKDELKQYQKNVEERRAEGEVIGKTRKRRSDLGKKRVKKNSAAAAVAPSGVESDEDEPDEGDKENMRPAKKSKTNANTAASNITIKPTNRKPQAEGKGKARQAAISKEIISESSGSDSEG